MKTCSYCNTPMPDNEIVCAYCGREQQLMVPLHHLLPGTMLNGKYKVGQALGEGGFGITYIGIDTKLELKVAHMILRADLKMEYLISTRMPIQILWRRTKNS